MDFLQIAIAFAHFCGRLGPQLAGISYHSRAEARRLSSSAARVHALQQVLDTGSVNLTAIKQWFERAEF